MHITYISSYVPRKCGIATYTRDLAEEARNQGHQISVIAMENLVIPYAYSKPVIKTINQNNKIDYIKAARLINSGSTDIVHLQHEFGLFGGKDGKYILSLAKAITKPLVVTFHTVLLTPSESQKKIIQELTRLSRQVVIMDKIGMDRLENIYGLNLRDLNIVLHGAPSITNSSPNDFKISIGHPGRFIMLANNLLSRNKGIEYGIMAVAEAIKKIPNLLFLIVGETHPLVKAEEGESYRNELIALVKKLGLEKNVLFKNKYVSKGELTTILSAADIYITPYLDPQQISSGTLSYAIGAGKACIATEYVYAKEMLGNNRGIIVPFRDATSIANALIDLYKNPDKKLQIEKNAASVSENMSWSKVAQKHLRIYEKVISENSSFFDRALKTISTPADISHMLNLTNETGIIQHAIMSTPDLRFGYSTCDNARALIVASLLYKTYPDDEFSNLIETYASFLNLAQKPDGKFHTFLNAEKKWVDKTGVNDGFGRAVWGLGFHLYTNKNHSSSKFVKKLFEKAMKQIPNIIDLRAAAYSLLGLYYYILAFKNDKKITNPALRLLKKLAQILKNSYNSNREDNWEWFETNITYDNFRLPQSLFAVYLITGEEIFRDIGKSSLNFITGCNFDKNGSYYDFIGQDGWHSNVGKKANYDQQPLEAAGAVDANIFASLAFKDDLYIREGNLAFEWFFGNNRNHRSIYDSNSKGVYDGLTLRGVNINQGAESIICFLISSLSLREIKLFSRNLSPSFFPSNLKQYMQSTISASNET